MIMYVNPFGVGFLFGFLTATVVFVALCYSAGKDKKQ